MFPVPAASPSVFDSPQSMQLDDVVDSLAADTAAQSEEVPASETDVLDGIFAKL